MWQILHKKNVNQCQYLHACNTVHLSTLLYNNIIRWFQCFSLLSMLYTLWWIFNRYVIHATNCYSCFVKAIFVFHDSRILYCYWNAFRKKKYIYLRGVSKKHMETFYVFYLLETNVAITLTNKMNTLRGKMFEIDIHCKRVNN